MNFIFALSQKWKMGPKTNEFDLTERGTHSTKSNIFIRFLSINIWSIGFDVTAVCLHFTNSMKWNETQRDYIDFLFVALAAVCSCLFVKIWKSNVKKSFTYARFLLNAIKSKSPNDSLFIQFYYLLNSFIEFEAVLYWKGVAALALVFYSSRIIFYISH